MIVFALLFKKFHNFFSTWCNLKIISNSHTFVSNFRFYCWTSLLFHLFGYFIFSKSVIYYFRMHTLVLIPSGLLSAPFTRLRLWSMLDQITFGEMKVAGVRSLCEFHIHKKWIIFFCIIFFVTPRLPTLSTSVLRVLGNLSHLIQTKMWTIERGGEIYNEIFIHICLTAVVTIICAIHWCYFYVNFRWLLGLAISRQRWRLLGGRKSQNFCWCRSSNSRNFQNSKF